MRRLGALGLWKSAPWCTLLIRRRARHPFFITLAAPQGTEYHWVMELNLQNINCFPPSLFCLKVRRKTQIQEFDSKTQSDICQAINLLHVTAKAASNSCDLCFDAPGSSPPLSIHHCLTMHHLFLSHPRHPLFQNCLSIANPPVILKAAPLPRPPGPPLPPLRGFWPAMAGPTPPACLPLPHPHPHPHTSLPPRLRGTSSTPRRLFTDGETRTDIMKVLFIFIYSRCSSLSTVTDRLHIQLLIVYLIISCDDINLRHVVAGRFFWSERRLCSAEEKRQDSLFFMSTPPNMSWGCVSVWLAFRAAASHLKMFRDAFTSVCFFCLCFKIRILPRDDWRERGIMFSLWWVAHLWHCLDPRKTYKSNRYKRLLSTSGKCQPPPPPLCCLSLPTMHQQEHRSQIYTHS